MNQEISNPQEMLATIVTQEETLRLQRFTAQDGWQLGLAARELAIAHGGSVAVDVTIGNVQVFRCTVGMATPNNARWIRRKTNVVMDSWKSSLRVMLELQQSGRTMAEFGWSNEDFVLSGGGFPLHVLGMGVVGAITLSGLPQTHDHQLAVDALAAVLGVKVPSILA